MVRFHCSGLYREVVILDRCHCNLTGRVFCSPPDLKLDVKKSSFKKLSKFLKTMQDHGILKLKENEKGSEVITAIDFKHPLCERLFVCLLVYSLVCL